MTSMTGPSGTVHVPPKWRLGEIGAVLKEHMAEKVDSVDQLSLYMQRNDADLIYGARLLTQIEAIIEQVKKQGINRDTVVAVESARPNTIPQSVQKLLTSNYSRSHQKEILVGLESWAKAGKMGLIVMAITALLKVISWIIENGKPFGGAGKVEASDYVEKVKERVDAVEVGGRSVLGSLNITTVKDAYLVAAKDSTNTDLLNLSVMQMDKVLSDLKAEDFLNNLAAANGGRSPFMNQIAEYAKGGKKAENEVLFDTIDSMLSMNITSAVFDAKTSAAAYQRLPKSIQNTGMRFPTDLVYKRYAGTVKELFEYFNLMMRGFAAMDRKALLDNFQQPTGVFTKGQRSVFPSGDIAVGLFAEGLEMLNNTTMGIVDDATRGFEFDMGPAILVGPAQSKDLVGYDEGMELVNGIRLHTTQEGAYFTKSSFQTLRDKISMTATDARGVLAALVCLRPEGYTKDANRGLLSNYSALRQQIDQFMKTFEKWAEIVQKQDSEFFKYLADAIVREVSQGKRGSSDGRELSLVYMKSDDFVAGLRSNMDVIRRVCIAGAGLQAVSNSSARNKLAK
ncbi:hypothetical protein pEaSNUABM11_00061 [Erwinia phage pEa_SNUABM_11]|nr:hypothetical protein pEaSNUABM11_00061 [Erwinia phage pEa_SNUABM_11]